MAKRVRVADLAREAEAELDEALVTLWDVGVAVEGPEDWVPSTDLRRARAALG